MSAANRRPLRILVVEPEPAVRETVTRLLALDGYEARGTANAEEALAWLDAEPFSFVICAAQVMTADGRRLARWVADRRPEIALVVVTNPEDEAMHRSSFWSADDFLPRQRCREDLALTLRRARERSGLRQENARLRRSLEDSTERRARELRRSLRQVSRAYRLSLESLVAALDAREGETQRHSRRVAEYTLRLADSLGVREQEKQSMFHGALLHDLGKIGIPDAILLKPAPLTPEEWRVMRSHPRLGYAIVRDLPFLRDAAACVLGHHERWDGLGYPQGLTGPEMPRAARVVAVADALDAMSVHRPYRNPLPFELIVAELEQNRERQFDPEVIDAALDLFHGWDDLHADASRLRELAESASGGRPVAPTLLPQRESRQAA
jgi:response regulator RpfG family c-di-GMP phosphodiesterase